MVTQKIIAKEKLRFVYGEDYHGLCDKYWRCINCKENHKANDKRCPIYIKDREIMKTMTKKNVTIYEARQMVFEQPKSPSNVWDKPLGWPKLGQRQRGRETSREQEHREATRRKERDKDDDNNSSLYSQRERREKEMDRKVKANNDEKRRRTSQENIKKDEEYVSRKRKNKEDGNQDVSSILNTISETISRLTSDITKLREKEISHGVGAIFTEFTRNQKGRMFKIF